MTAEERKYFDAKFRILSDDVELIKRGLYGDEKNNVEGLIKSHADDHKRLNSLEIKWNKVAAVGGAFGIVLWGIIELINSLA
jgi:hypothetical protein